MWAPKRSSWGMVTATMRTMPLRRQVDRRNHLCLAGNLRRDAAGRDPDVERSQPAQQRGQDHPERGSGELCRGGAAKFAAGRILGHGGQSDRRHDHRPENHPVRPQHLHHDLQARPLGNGACRSVFPTCGVFQPRRSALCGGRHQQTDRHHLPGDVPDRYAIYAACQRDAQSAGTDQRHHNRVRRERRKSSRSSTISWSAERDATSPSLSSIPRDP